MHRGRAPWDPVACSRGQGLPAECPERSPTGVEPRSPHPGPSWTGSFGQCSGTQAGVRSTLGCQLYRLARPCPPAPHHCGDTGSQSLLLGTISISQKVAPQLPCLPPERGDARALWQRPHLCLQSAWLLALWAGRARYGPAGEIQPLGSWSDPSSVSGGLV